jgi:Family of unknown function (DUF6272)
MEVPSIHEFHLLMEQHNLIMAYEGDFSQEITKSVLAMAERNLNSDQVDAGVKKKVYNVMVETLQNICKHQHVEDEAFKSAIFVVGETEHDFIVISSNPIEVQHIPTVKSKIDLINSKDKEGLKQLFKELRLASTVSEVGGAGLGFVDMARKSENKLKYQFGKVSTEPISYFTLLSTISKTPSKESI